MLLEDEGTPKSVKEISQKTVNNLHTALKTISGRNRALTEFIESYRQLSRLPLPERKELLLSEILKEIKTLFEIPCREKGITFTIQPGPDKLRIMADEDQLKQVLINMVKNASEAMPDNQEPVILISVKRILDRISLEIFNSGRAIPPDVLEKIFVPFYSTKAEGSGIGLSLSRQIISNHGGQILVESKEGKGTTFKIMLPVSD
jgi:signal transduction histidine kinase